MRAEIAEPNIHIDHVHLLPMVPPKVSISESVGTPKRANGDPCVQHVAESEKQTLAGQSLLGLRLLCSHGRAGRGEKSEMREVPTTARETQQGMSPVAMANPEQEPRASSHWGGATGRPFCHGGGGTSRRVPRVSLPAGMKLPRGVHQRAWSMATCPEQRTECRPSSLLRPVLAVSAYALRKCRRCVSSKGPFSTRPLGLNLIMG